MEGLFKMTHFFATAAESLPVAALEQIEQIEPEDLTVSNLQKVFTSMLPYIRTLAFNIVVCVVIFIIGTKIIKLLRAMCQKALQHTEADAGLIRFLASALDFMLHVFMVFMILGQLGVNTASIITVLGTLMLAVGMSLQGSLANIAGGILILLMHPFRVGHYIITPYGEGTVTMIGLVYTTLTMKDNRVLTIPNNEISNCPVTNCGQNPERRLDITTGIGYSSDIRRAKEILQEICDGCSYVIKDRPVSIFVDNLGDSSVDIGLCCYVPSPDFLAAKWEITEAIKLRFDEGGIEIPFPQVQVHMGS